MIKVGVVVADGQKIRENIIIIPKKLNRNGKYFAFVDVDTKSEARRAVNLLDLHGLPGYQGRQVRVTAANPPKITPSLLVTAAQKSLCLSNLAEEENTKGKSPFSSILQDAQSLTS